MSIKTERVDVLLHNLFSKFKQTISRIVFRHRNKITKEKLGKVVIRLCTFHRLQVYNEKTDANYIHAYSFGQIEKLAI